MKLIESKDGCVFLTVTPGMLFSVGRLNEPNNYWSIGLDNIGLGLYETEQEAKSVFKALGAFLLSDEKQHFCM